GEVTILAGFLSEVATARLTFLRPVPGFAWRAPAEQNFIDRAVFEKLKLLRLRPSPLCTDAEFVRRVHLDVCGVLPTPDQTRRFRDPQSRVEAVAQLFLGVRIGCARCHNHPAERWTQDDYYGLAAFFSRVRYRDGPFFLGKYNKEETVWLDRAGEVVHPRTGR